MKIVFGANAGTYIDEAYASIPLHGAAEDRTMIVNLLNLGLLCCNPNPDDRPSTRVVSQLLQTAENMSMSIPILPICKPHARYSRPGFSQFGIVPSSDPYGLSGVVSVEGSLPAPRLVFPVVIWLVNNDLFLKEEIGTWNFFESTATCCYRAQDFWDLYSLEITRNAV